MKFDIKVKKNILKRVRGRRRGEMWVKIVRTKIEAIFSFKIE